MCLVGLHNGYWLGSGIEDLPTLMGVTKRTGVDVLEIETWFVLGKSASELWEIRKRACDLGLGFSSNGGFDHTNDVSSDEPSIRKKGIEMSKRAIDGLCELGISIWSGINYGAWLRRPQGVLSKEEKKRIRDQSVQSLRKIVKTCEDRGIIYCLEIVNRFEQFLLNTVQEGLDMINEVGSPNVKLLLDTFHMNIEEDSITDAITAAAAAGRLGELHVGEANRRIIGYQKTHMDWNSIFATLRMGKFDGLVTMESFVIPGIPIASQICLWRDLNGGADVERLIEDSRNGAAFIRRHLEGQASHG